MKFYEVVEQVLVLLQRQGRVSYRALKREFNLDDEYLEDLKADQLSLLLGESQLFAGPRRAASLCVPA